MKLKSKEAHSISDCIQAPVSAVSQCGETEKSCTTAPSTNYEKAKKLFLLLFLLSFQMAVSAGCVKNNCQYVFNDMLNKRGNKSTQTHNVSFGKLMYLIIRVKNYSILVVSRY